MATDETQIEHRFVTSEQINEIAGSWIANEGKFCPNADQLFDLCYNDPENAWLVIQEIASREYSNEVMAMFAAGPLEDLLVQHGQAFIDRIEEKARNDLKFNLILGGVWQNTMRPEIWERIERVRKQTW